MKYWDASALVPLVIQETHTKRVRAWLERDPAIVTWAWTRVEIAGAVERRTRDGSLTPAQRRVVLDRFHALAETWDEVTDIIAVRAKAMPILTRHALRAADAAQLGAALLIAESPDAGVDFVCLDERLAAAAEREGLRVLA